MSNAHGLCFMPLLVVQVLEATTANGVCTMRIKAVPLPGSIATVLDKNADLIRMTLASSGQTSSAEEQAPDAAAPAAEAASQAGAAAADDNIEQAAQTATAVANHLTVVDNHPAPEADSREQASASVHAQDTVGALGSRRGTERPAEPDGSGTSGSGWAQRSIPDQNGNDSYAQHTTAAQAASEAAGKISAASAQLDPYPIPVHTTSSPIHPPPADTHGGAEAPGSPLATAHGTHATSSSLAGPSQQEGKGRDGVHEEDEKDEEQEDKGGIEVQQASGKVGILKQRLLTAAKEAGGANPAMLKVNLTKQSFWS